MKWMYSHFWLNANERIGTGYTNSAIMWKYASIAQ
jgi:hypothetical protein